MLQNPAVHTAETSVELEKLHRGQPVVEAEVLGKEAYFCQHRSCADRLPEQLRRAAGRLHQSQQHLDRSAFSRAVGAEKSENLSAPHFQGQAPNGQVVPK